MIKIRPLFAPAVAVLALALPAQASAQKEIERVDRVLAMQPGGTLKLKNFSGRVRITGTDRAEMVLHAVRRATRERLDRIRLEVEQSGSTVTVDANRRDGGSWIDWFGNRDGHVVETELEVEVPRRTRLDVSVFSSPVEVTGIEGPHDLHGFSATLRLRDVGGPIRAKTFSGDIEIDLTGSAAAPELEVDSFSGDIDVRLPASARGRIEFRSFSGDLDSDYPLLLRSQSRGRLRAELNAPEGGAAGNDLRFKTFSGDVQIRK